MTATVTKTPSELKSVTIDWDDQLDVGETIQTSSWESTEPSITLNSPAPSKTDTTTTVWLGAGIMGDIGNITNTIVTTNNGRTLQQSFQCNVVSFNLM